MSPTGADQRQEAVLLVGAPLCGKGTQARLLTTAYPQRFSHWESSAILRDYAATHDDALARSVGEIFSGERLISPKLLGDENLAAIISAYAKERADARTALLDGVIRTAHQAHLLADTCRVRLILTYAHAQITPEQLSARIVARARPGETTEQAMERIRTYERTCAPLLTHYRRLPQEHRPRIGVIDASQEIPVVFKRTWGTLRHAGLLP